MSEWLTCFLSVTISLSLCFVLSDFLSRVCTNTHKSLQSCSQPFVPTFKGIMKDYYSTDQNQPGVNSFRVSVHYTFSRILQVYIRQSSYCLIFYLELNLCIKFV